MTKVNKRGSSRRKGDEYQDLTALRLALENYVAGTQFEMFLEYEKSGNLDDIVIFQDNDIVAYQVRYAVNPHDVYKSSDFIDPSNRVYLKKFANSWNTVRGKFPKHNLTVCLLSNRSLDATLFDLITSDGAFTPKVIENRRRGDARKLRLRLASASGLDTDSFREFLADFKFCVRQKTLTELEEYIRTILLGEKLGLSDNVVFLELKEAMKENSIFSKDAITIESIDRLLERFKSNLLIPQVFPVEQKHIVEREVLYKRLDKVLPQVDGGYLVVTGLPGSGKSTSLTTYFDALDRNKFEVFKYYCFVGVNDNTQKMRVQAESLQANLLSEFQLRYPQILDRRFDYSEHNFLKCLNKLADFFVEQNRKFTILLDGLDHAERLKQEVRDTVLSALPADVPNGVVIIVGTQELHQWPYFLKHTVESPDTHIEMPLFSKSETQDYIENKRNISGLSHADIIEIHEKCEGLPLYLRYAAEIIVSSDTPSEAIASLAPATGGDIWNYYELLWSELDQVGMANARHLCAVMACLRFYIDRDELYEIQNSLTRPQFEDAYKSIRHVLRDSDGRLSVFHNSFREFIISQLSADWIQEIKTNIAAFLKTKKESPRWFEHVFEYCHDTDDYTYILEEVNTDFVERALLHYRPSKEILDAIDSAVESAFKLEDIVQLSRLGALKSRTKERLEQNLDRVLLGNALLALGREQDVVSFSYSSETNSWLLNNSTSISIMLALADKGKLELGRELFNIFLDEYRGIRSKNADEVRSEVVGIARCLGIYSEGQARSLRLLSRFELDPNVLERSDVYAPGYAPHLSAYIDALVQYGHTDKWTRLKRVKKLFPNRLVRYLLIRSLARHDLLDELRVDLAEYIEQEHPYGNIELAFYAAKAGMPVAKVSTLAGLVEAPKTDSPGYLPRRDPVLIHHAYAFVVLGYEGNESSYTNLCETIGTSRTLWNSTLRHLLEACHCIGRSFRADTRDWYVDACHSIDILVKADEGDGERIAELIDHVRNVLFFTIVLLTKEIQKCFPERLDDWVEKLGLLRDSLLWNTHFGINESRRDYDFELSLWESLAKMPVVAPKLTTILRNCAATYEESTLLKGECRSRHFIWLAALMAKCGIRTDARKWLRYGIQASLIYGYHKDITLSYLIDILKLVNQRQPDVALERCSQVLWMVDWMPHLTDGRETEWFTEEVFSVVLDTNRQAAFDLLGHFSRTTARWKMQDCLEKYILVAEDGDPEYLWCLSESFSNHYSDDGKYCKQIIGTRQHIVNLVRNSCCEDSRRDFEERFRHFVLTEITPRHWPPNLKDEFSIPADPDSANDAPLNGHTRSDLILDGKNITREEIVKKCRESFTKFLVVFEKLKAQNRYFFEQGMIDVILHHHIKEARSKEALIPVKEHVESQGHWQNPEVIEELAKRFIDFGDQDCAINCFATAYSCHSGWSRWQSNTKYLAAIAEKDKNIAKKCLLKECYDSASGNKSSYDTPPIAATGLDVLDETNMLETVFNDFLAHCESMFAQLPQNNDYAWLKDYKKTGFDENKHILQFLIKELETPEIDHGERLIRALTRLAIARPQSAIPLLVSETLSAAQRCFRRLLMILHALATLKPDLLVPHQQILAKLLERNDFFCRQSVLRILRNVSEVSPLEPSVSTAVQHINRKYSSTISHSTYRFPSSPSSMFSDFLKRSTLFDFSGQVKLMEKILRLETGSLVAAIEERLNARKWFMEEERAKVKNDWSEHVHPQGWPVIWVTTEFQELATEILWNILDEAAEKLKLTHTQIQYLWQATQTVDPEYVVREIMTRPADIAILRVANKETWVNELEESESFQVGRASTVDQNNGWLTVFENRVLAHEEKFNVPYRQEMALQASLIPLQIYGGSHELDKLRLTTERILPFTSTMGVTLKQARDVLMKRGQGAFEITNDCIPLIAEHQNPGTFIGYRNICTLSSFILDEFNLLFEGFDLSRNGTVVAKYEAWQEGYQDEAYTREKLSFGVRFRVHCDLLAEICHHYQRMICISINETREDYKSVHDRDPDFSKDSKRYLIYHL